MPAGKSVLLVDDIPEYLEMLELYLPSGSVAVKATSLEQAKQRFAETRIDLAVVDVCLKEKADEGSPDNRDGLELLAWIRAQHPVVPVIVVSAYREFEFEMESLARGAACFLRKPIEPDELTSAAAKALRSGSGR